jgi:hypothetical protein
MTIAHSGTPGFKKFVQDGVTLLYSLIVLTPGVTGSIGNNYNSMGYSVNGARATMMDTIIDGVTASFPQ